jgi:hypothetical protein
MQIEEEEEDAEEFQTGVEYTLEEGIKGFVRVGFCELFFEYVF